MVPDLFIPKLWTLIDTKDIEELVQRRTTFKKPEAVGQKSDIFALVAGSQVHSTLSAEVPLQQNMLPQNINTPLER